MERECLICGEKFYSVDGSKYCDNCKDDKINLIKICKENKVNYGKVYYNLNKGNDLKCSIQKAREKQILDEIIYHGKKYKNVAEVCRLLNINSSVVYKRLERGWTIERALKSNCSTKQAAIISTNFGTDVLTNLCKQYGIQKTLLNQYNQRFHLQMNEILELTIHFKKLIGMPKHRMLSKIPYCIYNNQILYSFDDLHKITGIDKVTYCYVKQKLNNADPFIVLDYIKKNYPKKKINYEKTGICIDAKKIWQGLLEQTTKEKRIEEQ